MSFRANSGNQRAMFAFGVGLTGAILSALIGHAVFGLGLLDVVISVVAANIGVLGSLLITLKCERTPWLRRHVLMAPAQTWALFLFCYSCISLGIAPPLRQLKVFAFMALPLLLTGGFAAIVFGPIQDFVVANIQKKARSS
jgi:hypothetical protein